MKSKKFALAVSASALCIPFESAFAADIDFKLEAKVNYRDSEANQWPINFDFDDGALPIGPNLAFLETVDEDAHVEISNIAFIWNWAWTEKLKLFAKIDAVDLYERNPTSSDFDVSIDRLILRYGNKYTQGKLPENTDFYIQFGKFGKFERQEDRHTESYGMVSTAFNRVEDSGFELGIDGISGWYAKLSYTSGNPVFIRDPNALAGDHGVVQPEFNVGVPILYDAEVEGLDLSETPETGVALGYRWVSASGDKRINLMAFQYQREMADSIELHGTFYGADLDILDVTEVVPGLGLATSHQDKDESGFNIWWYGENSSLFAQYVNQDIAGLERDGWEVELAYAFTIDGEFGEALKLRRIVPVVRYSELTTDFGGPAFYPSPSLWWDWTKTDIGFTLDFKNNLSLTSEYAITEFVRAGKKENNNELLLTLTWRYD